MLNVDGKTITLMGLGVLGRGVNVAKFLLANGANLIVTDLKSRSELHSSIEHLKSYEDRIEYVLERHRMRDFIETDLVVKGAGVSKDNKYIQTAIKSGVTVKMDASWAVNNFNDGVITVGVTGTKGKSSVSHLLHHLMQVAGQTSFLAGNVVGQATLPLVTKAKAGNIVILELDSWQLQGFHDEQISPNIAIFTNFREDHLNYYKGMPEYYYDKSAIYRYQSNNDYLILTQSSYQAYRDYDSDFKINATTAIVKAHTLHRDWEYTQPGDHNRLNATMAYQVMKFLEVDDELIRRGLSSFPGVPGRLEMVAQKDGKYFYNDTNATTPHATAKSIEALYKKYGHKISLICGGVNKGFTDFSDLIANANQYCDRVVIFPGGVADMIKDGLTVDVIEAGSMSQAVLTTVANDSTKVVLMSPAGSSFGLFKNEFDRGDQFNQAVLKV